jgi:hypothetical protein
MKDTTQIERGQSSVQQTTKMKKVNEQIPSARYDSGEGINNMPDHAIKFMSVLDPQGLQDAGYVGSKDHKKACEGMVEHLNEPLHAFGEEWKLLAYSNDHLQMNVAVVQHASGQMVEPSIVMAEGIVNALVDANVFGGRPFPLSLVSWPTNQHSQN